MLNGKKIVLGVTGSIAAYKAALLTRLLVKAKAAVKIVMTPAATQFITPITLSTLSKNPVYTTFTTDASGTWINHVQLGNWADTMLIAPASANTLAKMANGQCDNLLIAVYLSTTCPVWVVPCMDHDMWQHPATQRNIELIKNDHTSCIMPAYGELASGVVGMGRMAEPEAIVDLITKSINKKKRLIGKHALVTAGPTYEAIDPVRYVGNHASGKMGFALAEELASEGATVTLVSGPTTCKTTHSNITLKHVTSADEMLKACDSVFCHSNIVVFSAAVSDYKPTHRKTGKIKKTNKSISLNLTSTPDIATILGSKRRHNQLLIGFALETDNEEANALQKIKRKHFDFIALNSLRDHGVVLGGDMNKISLIDKAGKVHKLMLKSKREVAADMLTIILGKHA